MYFLDEFSANFKILYLGNPNRIVSEKCLKVKRKKMTPETSIGRYISKNIFLTKFNPGMLRIRTLKGSQIVENLIPNSALDIFIFYF
tara:strand:- start:301 stop:561 length:261 start_codon:yes stop_codon:yes gene_type:complete